MSALTEPSVATGTDRRKDFTKWVRSYTWELLRYTHARVKGTEVAEEIVQLTFVSAWETLDRFAGDSSPRTWLFAILKHKLADHYRRTYREARTLSGNALEHDKLDDEFFEPDGHWQEGKWPSLDPDIFNDKEPNEKLDRALRHCLDALPPNLRTAVEMKYLLDCEGEAIQAQLGITATNYWQQLHRAKVKLRHCIEGRITNRN